MMQYTRLITSLIKESIAANLGGYDVQDVIADKASGGDLVREILVRSVCDPRFQSTVRVARAWQDDTRDLLEEFAEGLMSSRELTMEDAMEKMEQFLRHYFFTMIQRKSPPDKGADPIGRGDSGDSDDSDDDNKEGQDGDICSALRDFESGPEEGRGDWEGPDDAQRDDGSGLTREEEKKAEVSFLRSIPPSLRRLASLIGRAGESDMHPSGHFLTASKSDIAGITVGDNLSSVLPSEIALLGSPATEDIFFRNYVGKRLQVFASASSGGSSPVRRQMGPVVICLDCSGSMIGRPSDIARALTIAVTIIATREQREVMVVKYGDIGRYDIFKVRNLRRRRKNLLDFLRYRADGGNDEDAMFTTLFTRDLPEDRDFSSADILCVSDFGWSPVLEEAMRLIETNKAKGMKFYGLDINGVGIRDFMVPDYLPKYGAHPPQIIDSMWLWDEARGECREEKRKF